MRGFRVALIERGDFAGATSSRSSKLIHGGLRYLPQGELCLVRTALAERERLRRLTAPHLVKPLRFLFPLYRGRGPGRFALGAGLWFYDLFARTPHAERHRRLASADVLAAEPMLNPVALKGGAFYYDAAGDDARLTIENALDAAYNGEPLRVAFNSTFLLDLLGVVKNGNIEIALKDAESAAELRPVDQGEYRYRYIVMPLRV
jgi:glycerol-3-phosphate dehydrogenase